MPFVPVTLIKNRQRADDLVGLPGIVISRSFAELTPPAAATDDRRTMTEYVKVGTVSEFEPGVVTARKLGDRTVAIVNQDGAWHAFDDNCTHLQIPLTAGCYVGEKGVVCTYHWSVFDLTTGQSVGGPAYYPIAIYEIRVEGDDVLIGGRVLSDAPEGAPPRRE